LTSAKRSVNPAGTLPAVAGRDEHDNNMAARLAAPLKQLRPDEIP